MPHAFVTGGTGFVGSNLVRLLLERGWEVTVMHRRSSDSTAWKGLGVRLACADVTDEHAVHMALPHAVDVVFHLAASVSFSKRNDAEQTLVNVTGTRHVVRAALAKGAKRFVQTSSVAAYGPRDGDSLIETSPSRARNHWINYMRTKWLAEREVERGIELGLDAVFVNPCHILGPGDARNWGRTFLLAQEGNLPVTPPGAAPWCHVSDVVDAHVAAAERGRTGERYLLAGVQASYRDLFASICERLGRPLPPVVPAWVLRTAARAQALLYPRIGKEPTVSPELAHVLCANFRVSSAKAERELGYRSHDFDTMIHDTFEWLRSRSSSPL